MAYVTVEQLRVALANAGGAGSRTAAELPDDRLAAALREAEGEVTGRLTGDYVLPDPGDDPLMQPDGCSGSLQFLPCRTPLRLAELWQTGNETMATALLQTLTALLQNA